MRLFRRRRTDDSPDPALADAAARVRRLTERAERVHQQLRPRMERNHWSETVHELWAGRTPS